MLQSFLKFFELGLYHILNFDGHDHILFVIIVSVPFVFKDWKRLLIIISVFTLGHTLSLILGVYDIVNLNFNITQWLIPITILFMAIYNILMAGKPKQRRPYLMYVIVLFFGLVHGLGFANAFESLVHPKENIILLILEFSIGIEIGQFIIVLCTLILSFLFQFIFRFSNREWVLVISSIILGFILQLIL